MDELSNFLPPNQVDSTSTRLLARVRQNDAEAWRQFVQLYGPVVRYWLRLAGLNSTDRADVFQEVFLAVSRSISRFERQAGRAKFRAWLKTVTRSKIQDHFRRRASEPQATGGSSAMLRLGDVAAADDSIADDDSDPALAHSEDAFLAQRTLQIVKKEFTEQSWKAFQLTALDGLTSQEVAAELGISAFAVRKAKSRVMQRLKEALGKPA
jgi:RNA polymerase sigma-70 factor (ECF subfamily)